MLALSDLPMPLHDTWEETDTGIGLPQSSVKVRNGGRRREDLLVRRGNQDARTSISREVCYELQYPVSIGSNRSRCLLYVRPKYDGNVNKSSRIRNPIGSLCQHVLTRGRHGQNLIQTLDVQKHRIKTSYNDLSMTSIRSNLHRYLCTQRVIILSCNNLNSNFYSIRDFYLD